MRRLIFLAVAAIGIATVSRAQVTSVPAASGGSGGSAQWGSLYPASSAGAQAAPYSHAVTLNTTGNVGTEFAHANNWTDTTWMQFGDNYAIRQTGLITSISFSWANPTTTNQYTGLYFVICRPSASATAWNQIPNDCPIVAKSANLLSSLTAGAINTISFCASGCPSTAIYAKKGDFYGFESTGTFGTGGAIDDRFHYDTGICNTGGIGHCYLATAVSTLNPQAFPWNVGWTANTGGTAIGSDNAIPVQINVAASPVFVLVGDSIIAGATRAAPLSTNPGTGILPYDVASDIGWHIRQATGWSYQNLGISGQTTAQIAARVTSDMVNLHPQFAILEGGVNDVAGSVSLATTEANWTTMLTAAKNAGVVPVCLLVLPWTNGTNTQNQSVDTMNTWLNGQCEAYGGYTVDARPYVGQFRTGGNTDNLWNIRPEYMSVGDSLQVHYSTLGYQAIARAILDRLGITTGQNVVRKNGVYYSKQQSLTASVSSTTASCTTDLPWAATTCESGLYRLSVYLSPISAAATSTVSLSFTYKDSGTPGNSGNSYTITTSSLDLSSASNNLQASYVIALDGLNQPSWSTTYSGTASYQVYIALERID
jgi:lysophospholipase L1-like esterase